MSASEVPASGFEGATRPVLSPPPHAATAISTTARMPATESRRRRVEVFRAEVMPGKAKIAARTFRLACQMRHARGPGRRRRTRSRARAPGGRLGLVLDHVHGGLLGPGAGPVDADVRGDQVTLGV